MNKNECTVLLIYAFIGVLIPSITVLMGTYNSMFALMIASVVFTGILLCAMIGMYPVFVAVYRNRKLSKMIDKIDFVGIMRDRLK